MKAEHRKELETNALAEGMGRMIRGIKEKPKASKPILLWIGAIVLALVANEMLAYNFRIWPLPGYFGSMAKQTAARSWAQDFLATDILSLLQLGYDMDETKGERELATEQGKVARFQYAWLELFEYGIKHIADSPNALQTIESAKKKFARLGEECEKDPVLGPESYYAVAVAEEALAADLARRETQLQAAIRAYEAVTSLYGDSAAGKRALKRLEALKSETEAPRIAAFYTGLGEQIEAIRRQHQIDDLMQKIKQKK